MVDYYRYYFIILKTRIQTYTLGGYFWYIDTDSIKTDCTAYLMCMIAETMFYEKGV